MREKFQATKKHLSLLGSILTVLFVLVIMLSANEKESGFRYLSAGITTIFGVVGYYFILPFFGLLAIYLILKNNVIKTKLNAQFVGVSIILFALLILLTVFKNPDLTFDNLSISFSFVNQDALKGYTNFNLGGGFIGFLLTSILNSLAGSIFTKILSCIIAFAGLFIALFSPIKSLILLLIKKAKERKVKSKQEESTNENKPEIIEGVKPIFTPTGFNATSIDDSMINSSMKKAHFNGPSIEPTRKTNAVEETVTNEVSETIETPIEEKPILEKPVFEEDEIAPTSSVEEEIVVENKVETKKWANYIYPSFDFLKYYEVNNDNGVNEATCEERTRTINQTFADFGVGASVISHTIGPSVTRFDVKANPGVSVTAIARIIDDISVCLGGLKVRFETIVSGKSTSGIEIPNLVRTNVGLREALESIPNDEKHKPYIPFGKNISGKYLSASLVDFPHLLVSGTTGSGKTIFVHSVILSLLMKNSPADFKLILIDPKKVEFTFYEEIPHLMCPIISEVRQAYVALSKLADLMDERYQIMHDVKVRELDEYNEYAAENNLPKLPHIVVFVDEYADLIELCKEIRSPIQRLCQKARSAGIHLILATQRPSVNVIDGSIKSNFSTRVALFSASAQDSVTILGRGGAETLLKHGDMLIESPLFATIGNPRAQGCIVNKSEINAVCNFLRENYKPEYDPKFTNLDEKVEEPQESMMDRVNVTQIDKDASDDAMYEMIKNDITHKEYCSISYIQRTYAMGFSRAGRMMTRLIREGLVSGAQPDAKGSKVLCYIPNEQTQQMGSIEVSTFVPDKNDEE